MKLAEIEDAEYLVTEMLMEQSTTRKDLFITMADAELDI